MIEKILVPIDGSETAQKGLDYALELAKQTGSSIILLAVINQGLGSQAVRAEAIPTELLENLDGFLRQAVEASIVKAEELCRTKGIDSQKIIREGRPAEEILKGAEASKADLIVMGSHGRSALGAAFLGSVTIGVMHSESKIPVLVVRR
jgi:nucleotide-binding universal stress UspA family protein